MSDTHSTQEFAAVLGDAVHSALIQGCAARQAILDARAALDAGDMDQVALIILSQTPDGDKALELVSIERLIYSSLTRTADPRSYG